MKDEKIESRIFEWFLKDEHKPGEELELSAKVGEFVIVEHVGDERYRLVDKDTFKKHRGYFSSEHGIPTPFEKIVEPLRNLTSYFRTKQ